MKVHNYDAEVLENAKMYADIVGRKFKNKRKLMKFFFKERELIENPTTKEKVANPKFVKNIQIIGVLKDKNLMDFIVPLYAKVTGKKFSNSIDMAKFFVEEREKNPDFKSNFQIISHLMNEEKVTSIDKITDKNIREARVAVSKKRLETDMNKKYGFNRDYIAEGVYHASLDTVIKPLKDHYHSLTSEEKGHVLGEYGMIGGTFTLSENKDGGLKVDVKKEVEVKENKTKQPSNRKSSKMQGLYDDVPEDVKKGYDEMMSKSFTKELDGLTNEEVAYLNAFFKDWCKGISVEKMDAEDAKVYAIYTKVNNRYKKLVKQFGNIEIAKDTKSINRASEAICSKIK